MPINYDVDYPALMRKHEALEAERDDCARVNRDMCAENVRLKAKLEAVLNCKEYAWKRMEGKYEAYFLKADVLDALQEQEDGN